MDDIIKVFRFGYLDAINDINSGYNNKNFINIVNKDFLSKIYDIGYIMGYNSYSNYIKNNL
ncbi:MAG: hypothetical protein IJK67_05880 [Bacilli bacterium]|nr:hypothetical protein [Bacilli bacterium]